MSDIKETFEWNLERASELLDMTDDTSQALATMALVGSVRHLIKALQIQSSDNNGGRSMMKEWMVEVTQVEFVIADSEEEAIKEAKKLCLGLGSDARYDATEIKSRNSDETGEEND